jgi:hypothetical protein
MKKLTRQSCALKITVFGNLDFKRFQHTNISHRHINKKMMNSIKKDVEI